MPKYRARETFLWRGRIVAADQMVDADDPAFTRNRVLFDVPVETATAAPGEKRNVRIPKRNEP